LHHIHRSARPLTVAAAAAALLAVPAAAHAATATGDVTVTPATGLKDGSTVSVAFSGFPADANVVAVQCSQVNATSPAPCDTTNLGIGKADGAGKGTISFTVHTGSIGNGTCDATHDTCAVYVSDNPQTTVGFGAIHFAKPKTSTPTPTPSPSASSSSGSGSGSGTNTPSTVSAGDGGLLDQSSTPWAGVALVAAGLGVLGARRRRQV
jgi:MYXO-CTERM domain-containing protein